MKINNVSCTQFAGMNDKAFEFTDGINVVYGKNESGKSTLANLISRTLFQDTKADHRTDKSFHENFFPSEKKGVPHTADFVDGNITFTTPKGTYTLTKVWGTDSHCVLSAPDGKVRDNKTIADILKDELVYGEGVYTNILFSSQRNTDQALQTILAAPQKGDVKQEIADAVSLAFAESDGISVDAIEQAINAKINEIAGKHWDIDHNAPERRRSGSSRWTKELGKILGAYYAFEDANNKVKEISRLEREADQKTSLYKQADDAVHSSEDAFHTFSTYANLLIVQSERKKTESHVKEKLERTTSALRDWPILSKNVETAKTLKEEQGLRETIDLYNSAKELHDQLSKLNTALSDMLCPGGDELKTIKDAQSKITKLENRLCGMNLTAAIKLFNENQVEVRSLRTGELLNTDEEINITEAVAIDIPGVMQMTLSPAGVNVEELEQKIGEEGSIIQNIFSKYSVSSLEELESLKDNYNSLLTAIAAKEAAIKLTLNGKSYDSVKAIAVSATCLPRSAEEIANSISSLCGDMDVSDYIVSKETTERNYIKEFTSISALKKEVSELQAELDAINSSTSDIDNIPSEFINISDPAKHLERLKRDLENKQSLRENALKDKTEASTRLEAYKDNLVDDPETSAERAERELNEQKELLAHWIHIKHVFTEQRAKITDNPLIDLANNFTHYLGLITEGKVASEFPDTDKLAMNIYSSDRLVSYEKLSEGTKETISLAFRLAVLDHLFPDGGGIALLDDPFANMDVDRVEQSVKIIKDFALRHQVIFLTCKEEYLDKLDGNKILL